MEHSAEFKLPNPTVLRILARAFLAGEASREGIVARASFALGKQWHWLGPLADRYLTWTTNKVRPRHRDVIAFLTRDRKFQLDFRRYGAQLSIEHWLTASQIMQPVTAAEGWAVPVIETAGDLAAWFSLHPTELDWFADLKGLGSKQPVPRLQHYTYRVLAKSSSSIRLIEAPKSRLKELQRQVLTEILEKIPLHSAVHGFVKGRSIKSFVTPHIGREVILRMDLRDFFPSIPGVRIQALFRTIGYPESVADLLGGICTNAAPMSVWECCGADTNHRAVVEAQELYSRPHLPQGAPTSPALANICAYRLDCRLAGLAKWAGADYTRYADDLAFSGDREFARRAEQFSIYAAAIALEEGFSVHHRKTRIMHQGVRQHLVGLVANQRANVIRADFDCLKATLNNCVRLGPQNQNRANHANFKSHLEGRITFVEMINPQKAMRLRKLFEQIKW